MVPNIVSLKELKFPVENKKFDMQEIILERRRVPFMFLSLVNVRSTI